MARTCDVLIVSAHPDDAEMAMGGTMIKFVDAGYKLHHLVLTPSQKSTYGDTESRKLEFLNACKVIGCEGSILDFEDTELENDPASRMKLVSVIRQLKPRLVFAPYHTNPLGELGGIANVDHYTAGSLARDAVKLSRHQKVVPELERHEIEKLYFYLVPRNVWAPLTVDVSDVIERVVEAINCYESQLEISFQENRIEHFLLTMRAAIGLSIGAQYAESFVTDLPLRMNADSFFEV